MNSQYSRVVISQLKGQRRGGVSGHSQHHWREGGAPLQRPGLPFILLTPWVAPEQVRVWVEEEEEHKQLWAGLLAGSPALGADTAGAALDLTVHV